MYAIVIGGEFRGVGNHAQVAKLLTSTPANVAEYRGGQWVSVPLTRFVDFGEVANLPDYAR